MKISYLLKAELKKILNQKSILMVSFLLIILAILTVFSIIGIVQVDKENINHELQMEFVQNGIEENQNILDTCNLNKQEKERIEQNLRYYNYLLKTDTCKNDYYTNGIKNTELGTYLSNYFFEIGCVIMLFIGIVSTTFIYGNEKNGKFRLYIAQGVTRKNLFLGKITTLFSYNLLFLIIIALLGLLSLLIFDTKNILVNDVYAKSILAISSFTQFFAEYLSLMSVTLFIISFLLFLFTITKSNYKGLIILITILTVEFIFIQFYRGNMEIIDFFPYFGLLGSSLNGFTTFNMIYLGIYVAFIIGLNFVSYKIFMRQEL